MPNIQAQRRETIHALYEHYMETVYRIAFTYMKNRSDAEDAVQESFVRLLRSKTTFESEEKAKAWLIVTVSNLCKDALKAKRRTETNLDDYANLSAKPYETNAVLEAILALDERYKTEVYLYYYEGYKTREIAAMLGEKENTVATHLRRAREELKSVLKEEIA